ncbi:MAG: RNA polymerase-associated protein RapA [Pseudomonadota bacterium]
MFIPGQRWISEAEPDHGLGVVVSVDTRTVKVDFTATRAQRVYAIRNAPLLRVRFETGDTITDANGCTLAVTQVDACDGLLSYQCRTETDQVITVAEQQLPDQLPLNRPYDKLMLGRLDADNWFQLRHQTWQQLSVNWRSPVFGLNGPRVALIPHQLYIAHQVANRLSPRVLLADEVGLGKTIEAGLIMHRLLLSERVQRVLLVVPEALIHQWLVEMLRRFNLHFTLFDDERFLQQDQGNPFQTGQRVLCSLEFLTSSAKVARAALAGEWDLLVVDEAHHLVWTPEESTLAYDFVAALAENTPSVLLLTATPEQSGKAGHFARLRLLDPQRFHDYAHFLAEEQAYQPIAHLAATLLNEQSLTTQQQAQLTDLLGDVPDDPQAVIQQLLDQHGTGRLLFRNTRQAIQGFPGRRVHHYPLALPAEYHQHRSDLTPEQHYPRKWYRIDSRVSWLVEQLRTLAPAKVLVICARAQTVISLRRYLLDTLGLAVAMFHEDMEIVERDRAAVFFADPEGAQALLCSEIGSEGRNFQFAHHLILFDLPLLPGLLEQRIGRLDRIGQSQQIQLHVPYFQGSAGEVLYHWYQNGLNAFQATCPAAEMVYTQLADQLQSALLDATRLPDLIQTAKMVTEKISQQLATGRDRLLELQSHRPEDANTLVQQMTEHDQQKSVRSYMHAFWDAFGVNHQPIGQGGEFVRKGPHMRQEHVPGLTDAGVRVAWKRADALTHEDREFLTWEHPIVRGAMDLLSSSDLGSATMSVCNHPDYPTGTLLLELLYLSECLAPAALEAQRYLPPTCHRLLLDIQGRNHADQITSEALRGTCLTGNKKLIAAVMKSQGTRIKPLLAQGESLAKAASTAVVATAIQTMQHELNAELKRLQALAEVNPTVRAEEIEQWAARCELLEVYLQQTRVRLDAIHVIVMR